MRFFRKTGRLDFVVNLVKHIVAKKSSSAFSRNFKSGDLQLTLLAFVSLKILISPSEYPWSIV